MCGSWNTQGVIGKVPRFFMPAHENITTQIKSRQRVADHGEVFTNPREVNAMLDLVKDESYRLDSRFLEPACGDGNFLIAILRRKLSNLSKTKSQTEWEFQSLIAVGSCYGIELLEDNAESCRKRLEQEVLNQWARHRNFSTGEGGYQHSLHYMLQRNIVCGDALTYRSADGQPITFCEWTPMASNKHFARRDFQFDSLVTKEHQYSLFDERGQVQSFDEPVRSYPLLHYTQLYRYEEQL